MANFYDEAPEEVRSDIQWLYNVEGLGEDPDEVIFVDRVNDVEELLSIGFNYVVTFEGSPSAGNALSDNAEILKKPKRIVLAGTRGEIERREELARRLGRHRCVLVEWPDNYSNAEETSAGLGANTVIELIAAATKYPIEGLYNPSGPILLALRDRKPPNTMTTGTSASDALPLRLPTEGRLIVVTGFPAGGKTSWTRYVMMHTAQFHDRKWGVFSPEMMPWEQFAADCAEVITGKSFWSEPLIDQMTREEVESVGRWLEQRLTMIVCDSEDEAPNMRWLLDRARDAVLRDGITDLLIDPWNEIDHSRPAGMTETDYIGRSLQQLKAFSARYGCNVWIIAHPAKPTGLKAGEEKPPPGPYDIASSAHWANKPDLGITIHSPEQGLTILWVWKARFRRFGTKDTKCEMEFNPLNGRFSNKIGEPPPPPSRASYYDPDT